MSITYNVNVDILIIFSNEILYHIEKYHVEKLLNEAIDHVTTDDWVKCVRHAENLQNEDLAKSLIIDTNRLVINLQDDSDTEDEE